MALRESILGYGADDAYGETENPSGAGRGSAAREAPTEYEVMMGCVSFKARRFARGMPVVVAAALLCLGVLPSLFVASGSEGSPTLGKADTLRVDQGANGNAPPRDGTFPFFAPAEEATDDGPVNAELLTMLFLAASSFFGLTARWPLSNAQGQGASCSSLGVVGEVVGGTREDHLPFLAVFRL